MAQLANHWHRGFGPKTEEQLPLGGWPKAMERRRESIQRRGNVFSRPLPFHLVIEGNVGAGKSTLLPLLAEALENLGHPVLQQPENVEHWRNTGLLEMLYAQGSAEGLVAFQTLGPMKDAMDRWIEIDSWDADWNRLLNNFPVVISERSARAACNVFLDAAPHLFDERKSHAITLLKTMYSSIDMMANGEILSCPDGSIFLSTPPLECFNRLIYRGRAEEQHPNVSLGYLQQLDSLHHQMFLSMDACDEATFTADSSGRNAQDIVRDFISFWIEAKSADDDSLNRERRLRDITAASQDDASEDHAILRSDSEISDPPNEADDVDNAEIPLVPPTTQTRINDFMRPSVQTRMRARAADMEDILGARMSQDGVQFFGDVTADEDS